MINNSDLTIYHKVFNKNTRLEEWKRFNYKNIWWFGGKGSGINKGYENANDVNVRIPLNENIKIENFSIGDILVKGDIKINITTQQDLKQFDIYNITSINNNDFGNSPHIHLGGK